MGINAQMQEGLSTNPTFKAQVDAIVKQQALIKAENNNKPEEVHRDNRNILSSVVRNPEAQGFTPVIVADGAWATTFDGWANDNASADYGILLMTQKYFNFLTGYDP